MSVMDWRDLVSREEDPEHLAGTEVSVPLEWGDQYDDFLASLVMSHLTRPSSAPLE